MDARSNATTSAALDALARALLVMAGKPDGSPNGKSSDDKSDEKTPSDENSPNDDSSDDGDDGSPPPEATESEFKKAGRPSKPEKLPAKINEIIRREDIPDGEPNIGSAKLLTVDCPEYIVNWRHKDKTAKAETLAPEYRANLADLRVKLDGLMKDSGLVSRLATKLQRFIMAQQTRAWEFDKEDGHLDPARLARVLASPTQPAAYRIERESSFKETTVTLLLDNSSSMTGEKIEITAALADILARVFERCGVAVEVLGFTTRGDYDEFNAMIHSKNWEKAGRGNPLRHIIYKDANAPYRRARNNFGLMLKSSVLSQNYDGEALIWAYNRLIARPQPRKILMVISDGEPCGAYIGEVCGALYSHLRKVIAEIEKRRDVELVAIGAEHDVTAWYKHAVTVPDVHRIGDIMMSELTRMFENKPRTP